MKILFVVGRELSYQRNDVLLRAFRRLGDVDVIGYEQRPRSLIFQSVLLGLRTLPRVVFSRYDLIFVGFYGYLLILLIGGWALLKHVPILFDAFVSNYDTLVNDREVVSRHSILAEIAIWLDRISCRLASHILLDTPQHLRYFSRLVDLPEQQFSAIPVGCNEDIFFCDMQWRMGGKTMKVLYYCTYQPLHGAHIVIEAANLLKHEMITFYLIGDGQDYAHVRALAKQYRLDNIQFIPFISLHDLRDAICTADICLGGHFGVSDKAARVIPGKIYQMMAASCPIIATDTAANRELLVNESTALLIHQNDPKSLADAIRKLRNDVLLRQQLAYNGHDVYCKCCSEERITKMLSDVFKQIGL